MTVELYPGAVVNTDPVMRRAVHILVTRHDDFVHNLRTRAAQEAIGWASAFQWRRRARMFEWARPRAGDYPGRSTPDRAQRLSDDDERCAATASACHAYANALEAGWIQVDLCVDLDDLDSALRTENTA